jgi:hypothetical protein
VLSIIPALISLLVRSRLKDNKVGQQWLPPPRLVAWTYRCCGLV